MPRPVRPPPAPCLGFAALLVTVACTSTPASTNDDANDGGGGGGGGVAANGGAGGGGGGGAGTTEALVLDLGAVAAGDPIGFDIPDGALGFHVVTRSSSPGTWGIARLFDPSGGVVHDQFMPLGGSGATALGYLGFATTTVPANDQLTTSPPAPGTWRLVSQGTGVSGAVYVQHTPDGLFHGGVLDLHVHIPDGLIIHDPTPAHAITAADAGSDPAVTARLEHFFATVEAFFGIERGEVTFHAIGAEHLEVIGESAFASLLEQTAAAPSGQALHVVWSNHVEPFPGYPVWGISPGLPGNVLETGTATSAIALAVSTDFNARGDGLTMVHELGHFVGLSHTTELAGDYADPIADTPECEDIDPHNLGACPDKTNIMFPAYFGTTGGVGVTVSATQAAIVHGAPIYRAYATAPMARRHPGHAAARPPGPSAVLRAARGTPPFRPCGHSVPFLMADAHGSGR